MSRSAVRYPVVELRQYTLHHNKRDVLIDLFDRELVESQEAVDMAVVGQFRDLDDPDRFVWLRGFASMPQRAESLASFYGGPVWQAHRNQANDTMIDSDNVLLLRPVHPRLGFPDPHTTRPTVDNTALPSSVVVATLYWRDSPVDEAFVEFFDQRVRPTLLDTGAVPLACLQTEYAENTFPALPVRTNEHVFVSFSRFTDSSHLDEHLLRLAHSARWREQVLPELSTMITGEPQQLRLAPTARSLLR